MPRNFSTKNINLATPNAITFPDVSNALIDPNGLLASGGELSPEWLLSAYQQGVFPWYNVGEPILWWSPDPRYGFASGRVHLSRSRIRQLRKKPWRIRADTHFEAVINHCANAPRKNQCGTWITPELQSAFVHMHRLGYAHSIEVFDGNDLIGGLYGLAIGQLFFAESMFSLQSQASAFALFALSQTLHNWQWPWIDTQLENPHLQRLGGKSISRNEYLECVRIQTQKPSKKMSWTREFPNLTLPDYLDLQKPEGILCTSDANLSK